MYKYCINTSESDNNDFEVRNDRFGTNFLICNTNRTTSTVN